MCDALCGGCDNVKCEHMALCVTLSREGPDGFRKGSDTLQFVILKGGCGCRALGKDDLEGLRGGGPTNWRLLRPRQWRLG